MRCRLQGLGENTDPIVICCIIVTHFPFYVFLPLLTLLYDVFVINMEHSFFVQQLYSLQKKVAK